VGQPAFTSTPGSVSRVSLFAALPTLGMGLFILWAVRTGQMEDDPGSAPPAVVGRIGLLFLLIGAGFLVGGAWTLVKRAWAVARSARRPKVDPDQPWHGDHAWDTTHAVSRDRRWPWVPGLAAFAVTAYFVAPFNAWAFTSRGHGAAIVLAVFFDLLPLLFLAALVEVVMTLRKTGRPSVALGSFPLFLGEPAALRLHAPVLLASAGTLDVRLHCVEEALERPEGGGRPLIVSRERYAEERTVRPVDATPDGTIPLTFSLPAEDLETTLRIRPPRYWELVVQWPGKPLEYTGRFLLPVYARR
jgi:hypothetical protein